MGRVSRKIGALLYYGVAKYFPPSSSGIRIGQKKLRSWCGKLMLKSCGKKVNIEQNALFPQKYRWAITLTSASMLALMVRAPLVTM